MRKQQRSALAQVWAEGVRSASQVSRSRTEKSKPVHNRQIAERADPLRPQVTNLLTDSISLLFSGQAVQHACID